jgi:hypothetical protein
MLRGTDEYNKELLEKNYHYRVHPQMIPFVGKYWGKHKKLLVLGESHYLPENTPPSIFEKWYDEELDIYNDDEIKLIEHTNTAEIIDLTWYDSPGHIIYQRIDYAIEKSGFRPEYLPGEKSFCYIAYMNFFQRPSSVSGEQIDPKENPDDKTVANDTLADVIKVIEPDYIFFVSKLAWDYLEKEWVEFKELIENGKIGHACHPAAWGQWYKEGEKAFIDFIQKNQIFSK